MSGPTLCSPAAAASATPDADRTRNPATSGMRPPTRSKARPESGPAKMIGIVAGIKAIPAASGLTPTTSRR
jgi:hypothetical protein